MEFEFCRVPVLSELPDSTYELGSDGAEKLPRGVGVLLLASASAAALSPNKMADGGIPRIEFSQGENRSFGWLGSGGGVEIEKGVVHGGTYIMTKIEHSLVRALR